MVYRESLLVKSNQASKHWGVNQGGSTGRMVHPSHRKIIQGQLSKFHSQQTCSNVSYKWEKVETGKSMEVPWKPKNPSWKRRHSLEISVFEVWTQKHLCKLPDIYEIPMNLTEFWVFVVSVLKENSGFPSVIFRWKPLLHSHFLPWPRDLVLQTRGWADLSWSQNPIPIPTNSSSQEANFLKRWFLFYSPNSLLWDSMNWVSKLEHIFFTFYVGWYFGS